MKTFLVRLLLACAVFLFVSCKKDSTGGSAGDELLVSATSTASYSKTVMQTLAAAGGYSVFNNIIKYDVDFYRIVYKTNYKNRQMQASATLAVPKNTGTTPSIISAQHGTIFKDTEAPSNFPATPSGFEICAAAGYITVIPDYIGYGVSKDTVHPYYIQQYSGTVVVDAINAAKVFLNRQKVAYSNRLFLLGYSEGGYVTMAAQKEIETHPEHNLTLTAAAEGAGGYDLTGMLSAITTTPSYGSPSYLALILQSYNTSYSWNRPWTDFFQAVYAAKMPALLDGSKDESQINSGLSTSPTALLNPVFYSNLLSASGETVLKQALVANSFTTGWYPKSPTRMYHGTADITVYYQTSVTTYNQFRAAGATNVTFTSIPNGTHGTSIQPMMLDVLPWLQGLDK